jgi:hypothetical protein
VSKTKGSMVSSRQADPEVTVLPRSSDPLPAEYSARPDGSGRPTNRRPGKILREFVAPDGRVIDMEVGDAVRRMGLEQTLPSGIEVNLEGWQRAHQGPPGLGAESGGGIRYAPPEVNLGYQNAGIERFVRDFNKAKALDVKLNLRTVAETHPNSLRLKSITYRLSAGRGDAAPRILFEAKIVIGKARDNPDVHAEKPVKLIDYSEYLAPKIKSTP